MKEGKGESQQNSKATVEVTEVSPAHGTEEFLHICAHARVHRQLYIIFHV
jgi:hypothetical protein